MEKSGSSGLIGFVVRLMWMAVVPFSIFIVGIRLIEQTSPDAISMAIFWLLVSLAAITRLVDVAVCHGETVFGEKATMTHVARYAVTLIVLSASFFAVSFIF